MVADGVYAAISTPGTGALGNAGLVDLGDAALVFDTFMSLPPARDLLQAAGRLIGKPVKFVFNSHYNYDHLFGNQVFSDATIMSTQGTRDLIATRGVAILEEIRAHPEYVEEVAAQLTQATDERVRRSLEMDLNDTRALEASLPELELRLSSITFDHRLTIHGAMRDVELLTLGGGHTDSDGFMLIPDVKVAFLGDLLFNKAHPSLWRDRADGWIDILAQIERMDITAVVPGHGPLGTLADVSALRQYWEELRAFAESLTQRGASAEDIAAIPIPGRFDGWEWPENYTGMLTKLARHD